jgi:hypothetical protein
MNNINEIPVLALSQANLVSISERLLTLARDTDRAGLGVASEHLLHCRATIKVSLSPRLSRNRLQRLPGRSGP